MVKDSEDGVSGGYFFSVPRGISETIALFGCGNIIFAITLFSP